MPGDRRTDPFSSSMTSQPTDIALLEQALATIERVLAHADSPVRGTLFDSPDADDEARRHRASAAQSAMNICLSSAAALVEVGQILMGGCTAGSKGDLERDWQALITHAKIASRTAYRAALIMASHRTQQSAQGIATDPSERLPTLAI